MTGRAPIRVLMVDDDEDDYVLVRDLLVQARRQAFHVEWERDFEAGLVALDADDHDVYLVDYRLGRESGLELLHRASRSGFGGPAIVLTGYDDDRVDVEAVQAGAADYLVKDQLTPELLERTIIHSIERWRIQGELRKTLEETIETKDRFLASISHRLRTPLTSVLGYAELLHEQVEIMPLEDRDAMVAAIVTEAFDMANVIDDLLVLTRIEHSQLNIVQVPLHLAAEVERVLQAFPDERQRVEVVDALSPSQRAIGDPARVRQIVRHLLANATEYGGPSIEVRLECAAGMARVEVADDGEGPMTEEPERMFDAYRRMQHAAGQPDSLGIGLTIARRLARLMGGDLSYRRSSGRSVFELLLQAEHADPGSVQPEATRVRIA